MNEELKKCPFCGSPAKIFVVDWGQILDSTEITYSPGCTNWDCIAYGDNVHFDTPEEAVEAWNKREEKNDKQN